MEALGIITLIIILSNLLVSYKGFTDKSFFSGNLFEIDKILIHKEYKRLITSGFLHTGWIHFIFNMVSLYVFSEGLEEYVGSIHYLIIYIASLAGGNLLSLFIHRNHGDYSAVGASGAVCGIIFASIALFPGMEIGFFGIPYFIPAWIYGILFVLFSIYGIKAKKDNIGHEAHLGGALVGLLTAIILYPSSLSQNLLPILLIAAPSVIFIYLILKHPEILLINGFSITKQNPSYTTKDELYYAEKKNKQEELDRLLEKIHHKGIDSLTKKERETLEALSK